MVVKSDFPITKLFDDAGVLVNLLTTDHQVNESKTASQLSVECNRLSLFTPPLNRTSESGNCNGKQSLK